MDDIKPTRSRSDGEVFVTWGGGGLYGDEA
jgi:hypothetical protein